MSKFNAGRADLADGVAAQMPAGTTSVVVFLPAGLAANTQTFSISDDDFVATSLNLAKTDIGDTYDAAANTGDKRYGWIIGIPSNNASWKIKWNGGGAQVLNCIAHFLVD